MKDHRGETAVPNRGQTPWWTTRRTRRLIGLLLLALVSWFVARLVVSYAFAGIPLPREVELPSSSQVFDADGRLITSYTDEVTRFLIPTRGLPRYVGRAIVAAEDRDFYEHDGVSVKGIARAAWENLTNQEVRQGGSTISQQYVKNAVLRDSSRTVERKLKEIILAAKLEQRYSKQRILSFYMNTIYFGRGAYGIEAAARAYFDKHAKDLTLAEAAYLAGIIPSPNRYQPDSNPQAARAQRNRVLKAMVEKGWVGDKKLRKARRGRVKEASGIGVSRRRDPAAYFVEWLRKEYLYPKFGDCLYRCGLEIHTTLDMDMQKAAEDAIRSAIDGKRMPQAALVSVTPDGAVRAFVGGRSFTNVRVARGFNHASDALRQAGSAFKPFTLLAALESDISPESRFSGESPKTITNPACAGPDGEWSPSNFEDTGFGTITLEEATQNSVNTVYAELISEVGPDRVARLLDRFGFAGPGGDRVPAHCSLSLGTLYVSPLQMARAFAGLAADGRLPRITPIRHVLDSDGRCLIEYRRSKAHKCKKNRIGNRVRVADANAVRTLTDSLTGVIEGGTGTDAAIGRPAAGKTGTTQDHRDAWFGGYVPQLATVVWVGYPTSPGKDDKFGTADDYTPRMKYCYDTKLCRPVNGIEVTGGSYPAQIWAGFMARVLEGVPVEYFVAPADTPDTILNPLPPPPPEPEPTQSDNRGRGRDHRGGDRGGGNGGHGNGGGGDG